MTVSKRPNDLTSRTDRFPLASSRFIASRFAFAPSLMPLGP
jgi:hypothetical protein